MRGSRLNTGSLWRPDLKAQRGSQKRPCPIKIQAADERFREFLRLVEMGDFLYQSTSLGLSNFAAPLFVRRRRASHRLSLSNPQTLLSARNNLTNSLPEQKLRFLSALSLIQKTAEFRLAGQTAFSGSFRALSEREPTSSMGRIGAEFGASGLRVHDAKDTPLSYRTAITKEGRSLVAIGGGFFTSDPYSADGGLSYRWRKAIVDEAGESDDGSRGRPGIKSESPSDAGDPGRYEVTAENVEMEGLADPIPSFSLRPVQRLIRRGQQGLQLTGARFPRGGIGHGDPDAHGQPIGDLGAAMFDI